MRFLVLSLVLLAAACSRGEEQKQPPEQAAPTVQSAPPPEAPSVVGTWSFDQSCASGDGMMLSADGAASYDEWGIGSWRQDGARIILDVAVHEPGVDAGDNPPRRTIIIQLTPPVGEHLQGSIGPGEREIDALRCP